MFFITKTDSQTEWHFRAFDLLIAIPLAVVAIPVIAVLAIPTFFLIDHKVLFFQERFGRNLEVLQFVKIRSITSVETKSLDREFIAEEYSHLIGINRWGALMRRYSLDELPQIFLVVSGKMTLVGPRPILQNELSHFDGSLNRIFSIKPGLTGYWQISGRKNLSWPDRENLDLLYLENRSFAENLKILAKTIPAVAFGRGAF
jgi:lipopolysaccharide/colanic/teichoic acid biosynthesis glycosyltransferase